MPSQARSAQVDLDATPYYHCISRCVRRAFLCGEDPYTGESFDHRKQWIVDRLHRLSSIFAVDVCAYAVMSNHFHVVLRVDKARGLAWDDTEVARRWGRLFKGAKAQLELLGPKARTQCIARWRSRLFDLSWVMRTLNEHIARRANREDECTGRFWEGRFKSQPLMDEAALLTCMAYVDLNPVRAGTAHRLEDAELTSIGARLREAAKRVGSSRTSRAKMRRTHTPGSHQESSPCPAGLLPFADQAPRREVTHVPMLFADYVALLEWTGRAVLGDDSASLTEVPRVARRLGLVPAAWRQTMSKGGLRSLGALGRPESLAQLAQRRGKRWVKGQRHARELFAA